MHRLPGLLAGTMTGDNRATVARPGLSRSAKEGGGQCLEVLPSDLCRSVSCLHTYTHSPGDGGDHKTLTQRRKDVRYYETHVAGHIRKQPRGPPIASRIGYSDGGAPVCMFRCRLFHRIKGIRLSLA